MTGHKRFASTCSRASIRGGMARLEKHQGGSPCVRTGMLAHSTKGGIKGHRSLSLARILVPYCAETVARPERVTVMASAVDPPVMVDSASGLQVIIAIRCARSRNFAPYLRTVLQTKASRNRPSHEEAPKINKKK